MNPSFTRSAVRSFIGFSFIVEASCSNSNPAYASPRKSFETYGDVITVAP
jgi:hypothetical protein